MGKMEVIDKGGRRMGIDRRQVELPKEEDERQAENDRRSGKDRRKEWTYNENDPREQRSSFYIK